VEKLWQACLGATPPGSGKACEEYERIAARCRNPRGKDAESAVCAELASFVLSETRMAVARSREQMTKDVVLFEQQCKSGDRDACIMAVCYRTEFDDTDQSVIACAKAHGFRVGNGWVANGEGSLIPGVLRSPWSISITCLGETSEWDTLRNQQRKVRPGATVWREYSEPEATFDLDAAASKACQAKYAELRPGKRKK
jgi:hypothetical protein